MTNRCSFTLSVTNDNDMTPKVCSAQAYWAIGDNLTFCDEHFHYSFDRKTLPRGKGLLKRLNVRAIR